MIKLNKDYRDMLELLNKQEVRYVLVGAYSMAVHNVPRNTADIDIFVDNKNGNPVKVYAVLTEFGVAIDNLSVEDLAANDRVMQIGVAPVRIDILTGISGVTFDEVYNSSELVEVDGIKIRVISIDMLIKNKSATNRDKDKLDIELLKSKKNREI